MIRLLISLTCLSALIVAGLLILERCHSITITWNPEASHATR